METGKDRPELRKKRLSAVRKFLYFFAALFFLSILINFYVIYSTSDGVFESVEAVPQKDFCLVLGANPYSEACQNRLSAAKELFDSGKVKHIIVSGDNHRREYNEPQEMFNYLVELGVPANKITLDFAGFRTLDSVYRAKHVFDVNNVIIVTQPFHMNRALYLASSVGLEAVGYTAEETGYKSINETREKGARLMAFVDSVIGREAKFTGPFEPIEIK